MKSICGYADIKKQVHKNGGCCLHPNKLYVRLSDASIFRYLNPWAIDGILELQQHTDINIYI